MIRQHSLHLGDNLPWVCYSFLAGHACIVRVTHVK
jgi:hypothetical protein